MNLTDEKTTAPAQDLKDPWLFWHQRRLCLEGRAKKWRRHGIGNFLNYVTCGRLMFRKPTEIWDCISDNESQMAFVREKQARSMKRNAIACTTAYIGSVSTPTRRDTHDLAIIREHQASSWMIADWCHRQRE